MPPLDILGTFQDPLNLDQGSGKLVNVRCTDNYTTKFVNGYCGYLIKNTKL